jgi:hypothetical protein
VRVFDDGLAVVLPVVNPLPGVSVGAGGAYAVDDDHEAGGGELVVDPVEFVADAFDVGPVAAAGDQNPVRGGVHAASS